MKTILIKLFVLIGAILIPSLLFATEPYNHDKWQTMPRDHIFEFEAFITSFDGNDDNNGDCDSDIWGIPEWVAFEIHKLDVDHPL